MVRLMIIAICVLSTGTAWAGSVALKWDHDGNVTGFKCYKRYPVYDSAFSLYSTVPATSRTCTFHGISSSRKVYFTVTAYNSEGESARPKAIGVNVPTSNSKGRVMGSVN